MGEAEVAVGAEAASASAGRGKPIGAQALTGRAPVNEDSRAGLVPAPWRQHYGIQCVLLDPTPTL